MIELDIILIKGYGKEFYVKWLAEDNQAKKIDKYNIELRFFDLQNKNILTLKEDEGINITHENGFIVKISHTLVNFLGDNYRYSLNAIRKEDQFLIGLMRGRVSLK